MLIWPGMKYNAEPGERGSHTDQGISEQEMSFMSSAAGTVPCVTDRWIIV